MLRRFGFPGFVALIGTTFAVALNFENPRVLTQSWKWVAFGIGVLALVFASRSLYRGLTKGWNTAPQLVVMAVSLCLALQPWIPQLQFAAFGIVVLTLLGMAFSF